MKQSTRTAAAVAVSSLLAGGGLAAAVTGLAQPAPALVQSNGAQSAEQASQDAALSAAVRELMSRNRGVHHQLVAARQELSHLDTRLHQQRAMAVRVATESRRAARVNAAASAAPPAALRASTSVPAPLHTTTGASGASGGYSSPPSTHVTTRASGAARHAGSPTVHSTTRASGGRAHRHDDGGHDD